MTLDVDALDGKGGGPIEETTLVGLAALLILGSLCGLLGSWEDREAGLASVDTIGSRSDVARSFPLRGSGTGLGFERDIRLLLWLVDALALLSQVAEDVGVAGGKAAPQPPKLLLLLPLAPSDGFGRFPFQPPDEMSAVSPKVESPHPFEPPSPQVVFPNGVPQSAVLS